MWVFIAEGHHIIDAVFDRRYSCAYFMSLLSNDSSIEAKLAACKAKGEPLAYPEFRNMILECLYSGLLSAGVAGLFEQPTTKNWEAFIDSVNTDNEDILNKKWYFGYWGFLGPLNLKYWNKDVIPALHEAYVASFTQDTQGIAQ